MTLDEAATKFKELNKELEADGFMLRINIQDVDMADLEIVYKDGKIIGSTVVLQKLD